MSAPRLRTAVIGFGNVAAGYADDPAMARHIPFATHAQVLAAHPAYDWQAVVDVSETALETARRHWAIPHTAHSVAALVRHISPEVAVLATPPNSRLEILEQLPDLRAVLVEKPLGVTQAQSRAFVEACRRRNILVQVNLYRRADTLFRRLAAGELVERIGLPQAAFGVYGNGLLNNGTHQVDLVRMLLGEVEDAQIVPGVVPYPAGPIPGDIQIPFSLRLKSGLMAQMQPIRFEHYRENSLDIWGKRGRLEITLEGLNVTVSPRRANRAMQGEREVASDADERLPSTLGHAFYEMYTNLADALAGRAELWSPGESALRTACVVQSLFDLASPHGDESPR